MKIAIWIRRSALLLALSMVIAAFAGCASAQPSGAAEGSTAASPEGTGATAAEPVKKDPVTITFWHNFGADKESPYFGDKIIKAFKAKCPWITVKVMAKGTDRYTETITAAIPTKSLPDAARLDSTDIASFAKLGALLALDDLPGFADMKEQMQAAPLATCLYKAKHYALPLGTDCKALVVNMTNLAAIGLKEAPATLEELITVAKEKSPGKYILNVSSPGEYDILPWFWLMGGTLSDEGFTKTAGYLDGPESVKAATDLKQLHDDKILSVTELDSTADAWDGIMKKDYVAFLEGPWFFAFKTDWKVKNLKPAPVPTYNGKSASIVGGHDIVIFSTSKQKDATYEFIKFLVNEETQVDMGVNMGIIPTSKAAAANEKLTSNEVWNVYLKQFESARCRMPSPQKTAIGELIKGCFKALFTNGDTPQGVLSKYAKLIDAELAK